MEQIIALSLFDGKSCGQVALKDLGYDIKRYYASEIEQQPMMVAQHHHPDMVHVGDVRHLRGEDFSMVNLIIGGSPCQSFSFMGRKAGMVTKSEIIVDTLEKYLRLKNEGFEFVGQSYLYWEFVRLYEEIKAVRCGEPLYFMLENVKMKSNWADIISKGLGVKPLFIDSALIGPQSRKRYYWTNIPNVTVPEDKGIVLGDVIRGAVTGSGVRRGIQAKGEPGFHYKRTDRKDFKANTVITSFGGETYGTCCMKMEDGSYRVITIDEAEILQGLKPGYTNVKGVSKTNRKKMLGNGWDIRVIKHILKNLKHVKITEPSYV